MSQTLDSQTPSQATTTYLTDYQAPAYFIDDIYLDIELDSNQTLVKSRMQVRRNAAVIETDLLLNGEKMILSSIKMDGVILSDDAYTVSEQWLTIHHPPNMFELEIVTIIHPEKNTELSGLYRSGKTYCTQCEAEGFRRITYFLDRPDVLTRYVTKISADESAYPVLLSNGNLKETGKLSSGRHYAVWEDPFRKPCYLFALVAGDFDLLEDFFVTQSGKRVAIKIFVDKGFGDQVQHAMYCIKEAMRWDEVAFGREYDLDVFMIVAIGDFNMGAMENKGLNIFNTKYVLAKPATATDIDYIHVLSVIGHEYFHNWSGNRVTCRDWFQLSLKEGLTIFRDQSFSEDTLSAAVMRIRDVTDLRESQFPEDAGPLAHPVRPDSYIEINNFYTATIYNKGSEVLRMMQTLLGKQVFRDAMDRYFARYDGQAVTIEDFVRNMEEVSGVDLAQFRRWYTQAGTPVLTVSDEYDEVGKTYILHLHQATPPTPGQPQKLPLDIPVRMGLLDRGGAAVPLYTDGKLIGDEFVLRLVSESQSFRFENVNARPIPSLLRHFSAPVKLNYDYSDDDLLYLCKNDKDAFNRWESCQAYMLRVLNQLIQQYQSGQEMLLPQSLIALYKHLLLDDQQDHWLLAEMLMLPSENYIGEQMQVVDVDAVHAAREFVLSESAVKLHALLRSTYDAHQRAAGVEYHYSLAHVGHRQLKNRCLGWLMTLPDYAELGWQQFQTALTSNMTDTQASLAALVNLAVPMRAQALQAYYDAWRHDPLVMDKWFAIQAGSKLPDTLDQVKRLISHPAFDIKNPNKVYALIGTFGYRNPVHFHRKDGEGYAFLAEVTARLDKFNPHVSARMVKPLTNWKRYDKERQGLMREQLVMLLQDTKLSTDLYELVTKSIE